MEKYKLVLKEETPIWQCQECGKKFKKNISKGGGEVKCPKCHSTDIDLVSDTDVLF